MNVRLLSAGGAVLALSLLAVSCGSDTQQPRKEIGAAPDTPPPAATPPAAQQPEQPRAKAGTNVAYAGELPPLPITNFPAARPPEIVNAAYEFAARRPDVLRYIPCFCGCERNGHVHNEHCFVAGREADGKPRWDAHGMS
jgi:hypothetical protein